MLNKRIAHFHELVWAAAHRVGKSAPRVTNEIIQRAFPRTVAEAELEGADKMLRTGVIEEVKDILRAQTHNYDLQADFAEINEAFQPIVKKLSSKSYFVESLDEYVDVPTLINRPALLDDARQFLRRKGLETLAEAKLLDRLYKAVVAKHGGFV